VSAGEKGLGVIAEMDIKAGTFVAEYIGEVVSREEAIRRAIQRTPKQHNYIFTVNEMIQGFLSFQNPHAILSFRRSEVHLY
jgi:hypothetical protein